MIPLDFFGDPIAPVVKFLPFKYLAYFPATIMLGRYSHAELAMELAVELGWVLVLFVTCRVMFARGVRRYSAFGG
jgi:ABC-2 type transport system permease protein